MKRRAALATGAVLAAAAGACAQIVGFESVTYVDAGGGGPGEEAAAKDGATFDETSPGDAAADDGSPGDALSRGDSTTAEASRAADAGAAFDDADDAEADASSPAPSEAPPCGAGPSDGACGPVVIAVAPSPTAIVATDSAVVWVDATGVKSVSPSGGAQRTLYANSNEAGASEAYGDLAADTTNAYFPVRAPLNGAGYTYVQTLLLGGGGGWPFDADYSGPDAFGPLAVDGANLYATRTSAAVQGGGCPSLQIDVVPLDHDAGTVFQTGVCHVVRVAAASGDVSWTDLGSPNGYYHPAVWRQPLDGGAPVEIAPAQAPAGIAVYGGTVYWADTAAGQLFALAPGGTTPASFASSSSPGDVAVDASGVYWIDASSAILKAPLAGGPIQSLATGQTGAARIALDASHVFWINQGTSSAGYADGAVMMLAK